MKTTRPTTRRQEFRPYLVSLEDRAVPASHILDGTTGDDTFIFDRVDDNYVVTVPGINQQSYPISDTFYINGYNFGGGGFGGNDTLMATGEGTNEWYIYGHGWGTLNAPLYNPAIYFSSIDNLIGGNYDDTFHFHPDYGLSEGEMLGYVDHINGGGGSGSNTFDFNILYNPESVTIDLQKSQIDYSAPSPYLGNHRVFSFQSIQTITGVLDATVIGKNQDATWTMNNSATATVVFADSTHMTVTDVEKIIGGTGKDKYQVSAAPSTGLTLTAR